MELMVGIGDYFGDAELSVPLAQVILFTFLIAFCFFFGRHKLGLLISYSFVFYWGFVFNRQNFINMLGDSSLALYIYSVGGTFTAILVLIGFFKER